MGIQNCQGQFPSSPIFLEVGDLFYLNGDFSLSENVLCYNSHVEIMKKGDYIFIFTAPLKV